MFWRRSTFPLDRVLAETLEPRVLYSATPLDVSPGAGDVSDWGNEAVHVGRVWSQAESVDADRAAAAEHHLSHLLDQTTDQEEWELLTDWIPANPRLG